MSPQADGTPQALEGIFDGPPIIGRALPLLRRLPPRMASSLLAWSALLDGLVRRGRYRRAWQWAGAQGRRGLGQYRLATALLLTHGRFVAQEALIGVGTTDDFRARSQVTGLERLSGLAGGAIILGLHVGPPRSWLALRAHGVPVCFAIRADAGHGALWNEWIRDGVVVPLPFGDAQRRVQALYRVKGLLDAGQCVFLAADGPMGRELCRLELPGTSVIIRNGWYTLRRQLKVPVFPISICENERRLHVTVHPPLPEVLDDQAADLEGCRDALTGIFAAYVARYPEQCRYLAFPPWES